MTTKIQKAFVALIIALALVSLGCPGSGGGSDDDTDTVEEGTMQTADDPTGDDPTGDDPTGDDPTGDLTPTTGELTGESLITQSITQPPIDVDILFVLDASGSLVDERERIAMALEQFMGQLEETPSFTVAFTLGLISEDPIAGVYDGSGRLYNVAPHPAVLSSDNMTNDAIIAVVKDTLLAPKPDDGLSDGGEAGLYSLNLLLTTYHNEARALGFLRPGAALIVIFLSDENDICSLPTDGSDPVPDTDGLEDAARATYCGSLTPASVVAAAQSATNGAPVQFSGIVYTGPVVPLGGENEIGYGYLETISLTEGVAVDLASPDFSAGAQNLGNTINALAANLQRRFVLTEEPVNPLSIEVLVDGVAVDFEFIPADNAVLLAFAGHPGSTIEINYRVLDE